jgi:hypothetical protein
LSEQGVPQGHSLSPIPFLFYNVNLVDVCYSTDLPAFGICFVDDANVLAFVKGTEETSPVLKNIHSNC